MRPARLRSRNHDVDAAERTAFPGGYRQVSSIQMFAAEDVRVIYR
jgi:hypothetical protein